jgi:hypothetical protein
MAKIIIKLENGAYNYYEDDKLVKSNLSVRKVVRKNGDVVGDIVLPENPYGKKTISTTRFNETTTEYDLANATVRTTETSSTPRKSTPKFNPEDYLNEKQIEKRRKLLEELSKIDTIAEAEYKKVQALNELETTLRNLDPDTLKALMTKMNGAEA